MHPRHIAYWLRRRLVIHHPRVLGRWLLSRVRPEVILVELTNDCDQACPFCAREVMTRDVGYMAWETFTAIMDEAAGYPYVLVRLVGLGEASLHPQFRDCLDYAAQKGIPLEITSNGRIFEVLSPEEICASSIVMLSVSVDGFGDGSYEKLRVNGNYQRLRDRIAAFADYRRRARVRRPLFTMRNVLLSKDPAKKAAQAQRFAQEWGAFCDRMSFNDYIPQNLTRPNPGTLRVCDDIFQNLHVEWNGATPICAYQHLIADSEDTGTAGQTPLAEIWAHPRRQEIRRAHVTGDLSPCEFCRSCPKTREAAVYRNSRDHARNRNPVRHVLERLVWKIVS